jgi:hypothetical protein
VCRHTVEANKLDKIALQAPGNNYSPPLQKNGSKKQSGSDQEFPEE